MRKIRLSDTDLELFDIEIGPDDYTYYQRHKDAFKTMWKEQGKPFWTRFQITFRSFTVKHGVIKHMNIDSPKFQNILDEAFIFIHEHFVDGRESTARNFIDDIARLAQNQDKFPALDSKSFSKDPFFTRDTRELFRKFFGKPDQKSSYLKVYILCPVYLRFGGSVCRCLIRWMDAELMSDPSDDSYWVPPQSESTENNTEEVTQTSMCSKCVDDCGTKYFNEKIMGNKHKPVSLSFWTLGDPRFSDPENPLFAPHSDPSEDWRNALTVDMFRDFYNYAKFKYGEGCPDCTRLKKKRDHVIHVCKSGKKKKKQNKSEREVLIKDLREIRDEIQESLEENIIGEVKIDCEERRHNMIVERPRWSENPMKTGIKPSAADKAAEREARERKIRELEEQKAQKEKEMRAFLSSESLRRQQECEEERMSNFTKQIGCIRICKHLAGNPEAEADARELDRLSRERRSSNSPKAKCTCHLGQRSDPSECSVVPVKCYLNKHLGNAGDSPCDFSNKTITSQEHSAEKTESNKGDAASAVCDDNKVVNNDNNTAGTDNKTDKEVEEVEHKQAVSNGSNDTANESKEVNAKDEKNIEKKDEGKREGVRDNDKDTNSLNDADKFPIQEVAECETVDNTTAEKSDQLEKDNVGGKDLVNDDSLMEDKLPVQEHTGQAMVDLVKDRKTENNRKTKKSRNSGDSSKKNDVSNKSIVSGFKVLKIEDQENNLYEVSVSAAYLTSGEEDSIQDTKKKTPTSHILNSYILSAAILCEKIPGLPRRLEWWEGQGFAIAIVNYIEEEKQHCKHWTNFTLKVSGSDEFMIKRIMIQLLIYVSKRKRRACYGWCMEMDDIVACILPEEASVIKDLSITVSRGFPFEDRLSEFENKSLLMHYPSLNMSLVLFGLEKGEAVKALEMAGGCDILRDIINTIADEQVFSKDLPVVDVNELSKKLDKDNVTKADILWDQLITKPDTFEIYALLDKELVMNQSHWLSVGMKCIDIHHYNATVQHLPKICPICKIAGLACNCNQRPSVESDLVKIMEATDYDKVKLLGEENGPDLGKMKYKETSLSTDNSDNKPDQKQSGRDRKKKDKKPELSDLPAKLAEAGLDADRTLVTVPGGGGSSLGVPEGDGDHLTTIPGVQGSLNFTIQNGVKEQTITVTMGAYLPEERVISEIQDKAEQLKSADKQETREDKSAQGTPTAVSPAESDRSEGKKDKKKKKKDKTKSKSSTPPVIESSDSTSQNKSRDHTIKLPDNGPFDPATIRAIARQMKKFEASNPGQQISPEWFIDENMVPKCDCPDHDDVVAMVRKRPLPKSMDEKDQLVQEALGISEVVCKKGKKKIREIQIRDTPQKCQCGKCEVEAIEMLGIEMPDSLKETKKQKKKPGIPESVRRNRGPNSETEQSVADCIPDDENKVNENLMTNSSKSSNTNKRERDKGHNNYMANKKGEKSDVSKDVSSDEKEGSGMSCLRTCGCCMKIEPTKKTFKKCQKCKDEGVLEVRYYCSRECQLKDWKIKHKMEHKDGLLG